MTRRLRLLAALVLAALAGWWAHEAARSVSEWDEVLREANRLTLRVLAGPDGDVRPDETCPVCIHLGSEHDPDIGCTVKLSPGSVACACPLKGCRPCRAGDPPGSAR